ncbi:MAG TPA: TraR/DksA C4-type zinc finger protein [Candidatus Saccharimonadales bacterium]|nr:TraR/DksA C4-type zinc finger protein [Candidatus Saccharimonadales bacterium]
MEKKKIVAARKTGAGRVSVKVEKKAPARRVSGAAAADKPFTEDELRHYEELLKARLRQAGAEMEHLEETVLNTTPRDAAGDLSAYSFHMADLGTDAMERELAFQMAAKEGGLIKELREALKRLYRNEYGLCELCGLRIGRPRLEAVPEARLCIQCKEKEERRARMMRE